MLAKDVNAPLLALLAKYAGEDNLDGVASFRDGVGCVPFFAHRHFVTLR